MTAKIRIAVMSDLHFIDCDPHQSISYVDLSKIRSAKQDPITDLFDLIETHALQADLVLTPGDLTVAANAAGLAAAWDSVHKIGLALNASSVVAATGNHDISSRDTGDEPEIWERLKKLSPSYPSPSLTQLERLRYWGDHFAVLKVGPARIVVLNTCNSHARGDAEYSHGRITDYLIEQLIESTPFDSEVKVNILLCHHHPIKYSDLTDKSPDYSEMRHGTRLLDALAKTEQPWLVIHGHKHFPKMSYAGGNSAAVTVFSAGSLSAILNPVHFSTAVNQFYILELDLSDLSELGLVGVVHAWDWVKGAGWEAADYRDSHPGRLVHGSGFGYKANLNKLASDIDAKIGNAQFLSWTDVLICFPHLKYLLIDDCARLFTILALKSIKPISASPINPVQLTRVR